MTRVKILLFATLRERAGGAKFIELDLPENSTVHTLKEQVASQHPNLAPSMKSVIATINREFAFDEARLPTGAEFAMFPPVSGG